MALNIDAVIEDCRREEEVADLSAFPHVLHAVAFNGTYEGTDCEPVDDIGKANGFSSEIADGPHEGMHTVAIDLDVPARLVPSSTPGHSHLYIDVPMPWDTYLRLLQALGDAGILEPGYIAASEWRRHTTLRLPWVSKDRDPIALDRRLHCVGCRQHPSQIRAYDPFTEAEGDASNAAYVWRNEGTLNIRSGGFYCDSCYIAAGQPLGTA